MRRIEIILLGFAALTPTYVLGCPAIQLQHGASAMPSFDIVSEVDRHEVNNAVDQANREIGARFDFKGSDAKIEYVENSLKLEAQSEFQIDQMRDILEKKLAKRGIDLACTLIAVFPEKTPHQIFPRFKSLAFLHVVKECLPEVKENRSFHFLNRLQLLNSAIARVRW